MFESHLQQRFQEFKQALLQLHTVVIAENPDWLPIQENFRSCQQIFQSQIAILTDNDLDPSALARWQPFQTEVHRLLRLLEMDIMFLQASRRSVTASSRTTSMSDRIKTLIGWCDALLQKE